MVNFSCDIVNIFDIIRQSFPFRELEETTRMPLYYVNEDYPTRPEIQ